MTKYLDHSIDFEFKGFTATIRLFHGLHQQLFINLTHTGKDDGIHHEYCLFCLACKKIPSRCVWKIGRLTYSISKDQYHIFDTENNVEIDCSGFRICAPFVERDYFASGVWPEPIYTVTPDGSKVCFIEISDEAE